MLVPKLQLGNAETRNEQTPAGSNVLYTNFFVVFVPFVVEDLGLTSMPTGGKPACCLHTGVHRHDEWSFMGKRDSRLFDVFLAPPLRRGDDLAWRATLSRAYAPLRGVSI